MLERISSLDGLDAAIVLCAAQRLTRELRAAHGRAQAQRGLARWRPLATATLTQWLDDVIGAALLSGELPVEAAPRLALTGAQERILWERAIAACAEGAIEEALFDSEGLAAAASEANALMVAWGIRPEAETAGEETRRFLRWRAEFRKACEAENWLEAVRHLDWQIGCLARGAGTLPATVVFAGFDRLPPQERRLATVLAGRGVTLLAFDPSRAADGASVALALPDRQAECRAAAAWAARRRAAQPDARLAVVVPELGNVRETLADALDEALHPEALAPARAEMPRAYDFARGLPLARQPLVATALELLGLAAAGASRIGQERIGTLLRCPYWSVEAEADARDRLEALLREKLAPEVTLGRVLRLARRAAPGNVALAGTLACLEALKAQAAAEPARQAPSRWVEAFARWLTAAGWPGERPLSGHERLARRAFHETLQGLVRFDALLGRVSAAEALRRLRRLCGERIFQPEAEEQAAVRVMGLLDALAEPLDALWVMGMNDHLWPPPARPNPLLPAELQRRAASPAASAEVQAGFARTVHQRLLKSAAEVVFSWSQGEAGRDLRMSPLLATIRPAAPADFPLPAGLIERQAGQGRIERLDDGRAPEVGAGETPRGGTGLLKAQALCPAWAFYQYRLGARALAEPVEGLDASDRGSLLHGVLEHFWRKRGLDDLRAMNGDVLADAIGAAVDAGLAEFNAGREEPLSPRFVALERERLRRLVAAWLAVEAARAVPFRVIAREQAVAIEIEGIAIRLVVDRIDELADGRRLILDYKTGATPGLATWNEARIGEPQLPVYAALAAQGEVVGAAFARIRPDECGFVGIAAEAGLLPKVAGIGDDATRRLFPAVTRWDELLEQWRANLKAIAREIRAGEAAVRCADEKALEYCEVKPLLRLAERRMQIEAAP